MLQKEMTTEFEKLIKQPVHMRCRTKAASPAATSAVKAQHITAADTEYPETMTSTEPTTHHDKCPYSPSDVIIQLKVGKKSNKLNILYLFIVYCDITVWISILFRNQGSHSTWKNESTPGKPGNIMEF